MPVRLKLLALLFAVPLLAIVVAYGGRAYADSQLRAGVRAAAAQRGQAIDGARLEAYSMAQLCADRDVAGTEECATYSGFGWLGGAGAIAVLIAVLMLGAIRWAGRACQRDRLLLLRVFRPGLRAVFIVLIVLIVMHAGLVIGGMVLVGISGGGVARLLFWVAIGAAMGVWRIIRESSRAVEKASTSVVGKVLEDGKHPALLAAVQEVARTIGSETPERIVAGLDPSFFVTEADVHCIDGKLAGRTLYVSLPLCRILTAAELRAIIGHELGHFKGLDTQFSERFYPIYSGATRSLMALAQTGGGARSIAILPAFYLLGFFLESFNTAHATISRERELAADAEAGRAAGREAIASALVKVHAYSPAWAPVVQAMGQALAQHRAFTNVSTMFAEFVCHEARPEHLQQAADARLMHPTDSHPPLVDRLAALDVALERVSAVSLALPPASPAIALFDDVQKLEEDLSAAQHQWLINTGQAQLGPADASSAGQAQAHA